MHEAMCLFCPMLMFRGKQNTGNIYNLSYQKYKTESGNVYKLIYRNQADLNHMPCTFKIFMFANDCNMGATLVLHIKLF